MVLTISPVRKKFTLAISAGGAILHSMMKNEPTRQDILDLILDHAANQNVTIDLEDLKGYSLEGLYNVLLDLEANI